MISLDGTPGPHFPHFADGTTPSVGVCASLTPPSCMHVDADTWLNVDTGAEGKVLHSFVLGSGQIVWHKGALLRVLPEMVAKGCKFPARSRISHSAVEQIDLSADV